MELSCEALRLADTVSRPHPAPSTNKLYRLGSANWLLQHSVLLKNLFHLCAVFELPSTADLMSWLWFILKRVSRCVVRLSANCPLRKSDRFQMRHWATTSKPEPSRPSFRFILILSSKLLLVIQVVFFLQIFFTGIVLVPIMYHIYSTHPRLDLPDIGSLEGLVHEKSSTFLWSASFV